MEQASATRRDFLRQAAAAAAAAGMVPAPARAGSDRLGVGIIGAGGRANSHVGMLQKLQKAGESIDIVAVYDTYRPRAERMAKRCGEPRIYTKYRELLADPAVQVVLVATPDHHHGVQAIDAVQAGKDVYCEKPITHWRQFELTKKLAEVVAKSDRVFQVGTQGMSDGAWHLMKKLVQDGLIGQPIHAECGYFRVGDWGERGMPIDDKSVQPGDTLNWEEFLGDAPKRPFDVSRYFRWRMYEDYAGGPVTDLFPHSFTPVADILGLGFPSRVVATGGMFRYTEREIPDTFNMLVDYPEKITVAILGTQGNDNPGTGGRGAGNRIPTIRGWDGTLTVQGNEVVFTPAQRVKKEPRRFTIEYGEDNVRHWKQLLDCCRTRDRRTYSPMDLAYRVQTALIMGFLSLRESKVAKFDPDRQQIVLA